MPRQPGEQEDHLKFFSVSVNPFLFSSFSLPSKTIAKQYMHFFLSNIRRGVLERNVEDTITAQRTIQEEIEEVGQTRWSIEIRTRK